MNKKQQKNAATFSMVIAHIISKKCAENSILSADFYARSGISQPSWSRLCRGQTNFNIEDLLKIEHEFDFDLLQIIQEAKNLEGLLPSRGIEIIPPTTTQTKNNLKELGYVIVAGAVLGFLANEISNKE